MNIGLSTSTVCSFASALLLAASALAGPVIGDPSLIDAGLEKGIVVDLDTWFAAHPLKAGAPSRSDTVFKSPRTEVVTTTNRGSPIGIHHHRTADELVLVHKGRGEIHVDGKWVPVKAGDLHVNPRGVLHATRVAGGEDLLVVSIFTPPRAGGNDKVPAGGERTGQVVGDETLIDTKWDKGFVLSLDTWFAEHPIEAGKPARSDGVFASPRGEVAIAALRGASIPAHHHTTFDEIVLVTGGEGEMRLNDDPATIGAGKLHINPRGTVHATRATKGDLRVVSIFAGTRTNADDRVPVKMD